MATNTFYSVTSNPNYFYHDITYVLFFSKENRNGHGTKTQTDTKYNRQSTDIGIYIF